MYALKNARIYTPQETEEDSVLLVDGRKIVYVGDESGAEKYAAGYGDGVAGIY